MEYNWYLIKDVVKTYCQHAFQECSLSISDTELDEALVVFNNILLLPLSGCPDLDGLNNRFPEALVKTCKDDVGNAAYLDTITTDFEAYIKKILVITGHNHYANLCEKSWTLWPLYRELGISPNFVSSNKPISSINLEDFKTDPEAIYILGYAYKSRNDIHQAKDLDLQQFASALKYSLALYVWITHSKKSELLSANQELNKEAIIASIDDMDNRYIYDFMSFGKKANEIKNHIVESYILNKIYSSSPQLITKLIEDVKLFSQNSLNDASIKRFFSKMEADKRIDFTNVGKTEVVLTSREKQRLKDNSDSYALGLSTLKASISSAISELGVNCNVDALLHYFSDFLDDNFNKNIEVSDGDGASKDYSNYSYLISNFEREGLSHKQAEQVFVIIVNACESNKILYKLSVGRVFSKFSNKNTFNNYLRQDSKEIFLDTQIVLYLLCLNDDFPKPTKGLMVVAKNLAEMIKHNRSLLIEFPRIYFGEVLTHFRRALNLLSLTKNAYVDGMPISNNVFYKYYCDLKYEDVLPEGVNSFADYLRQYFELEEKDLYEPRFKNIVFGIVCSILQDELGIEVYDNIPHLNDEELSPSIDLFKEVIKENELDDKDGYRLKSDAIIGRFLFESKFNNEPFFLTYDRSFRFYKEKYLKNYKRRASSYFWHLLSPSQFINHMDLLNLKIDENRLSNELLALIECDDFESKTHSLIDDICRFTDIQGVTSEQREKNIKILMKQLVGEGEFSMQIETISSTEDPSIKKFCELSNDVYSYFLEKGGAVLEHYVNIFTESDKYNKLIKVIKEYSSDDAILDYKLIEEEINSL